MKIKTNFLVVSQYHFDVSWVENYTNNYIIYDKGHTMQESEKVKRLPNLGHNIGTYMTHIIENYDSLHDVTIFVKGDVFPRHCNQEKFDRLVNNKTFTSLESYDSEPENGLHVKAADGGYAEVNNSWYVSRHVSRHIQTYNEFMSRMFKNPPRTNFVRFPPGANFIVPKHYIYKYPKSFYEKINSFIQYLGTEEECLRSKPLPPDMNRLESIPAECHIIERALHTIWTGDFEVNDD